MNKTKVNWELMHKNITEAYEEVLSEVLAAHRRGGEVPYDIGSLRFHLDMSLSVLKRLKDSFV